MPVGARQRNDSISLGLLSGVGFAALRLAACLNSQSLGAVFGFKRLAILFLVASGVVPLPSRAQAPVFKIAQEDSTVKFSVKASR
jgi:hypothetical protein